MDFLPLSIWAVGIFFVGEYSEYNKYKQGYSSKEIDKVGNNYVHILFIGNIVFLALGFVSLSI